MDDWQARDRGQYVWLHAVRMTRLFPLPFLVVATVRGHGSSASSLNDPSLDSVASLSRGIEAFSRSGSGQRAEPSSR